MSNGKIRNKAFMHVFVNTSDIKRLEKEKATNKWLHIMFSSISHEFRTPLNAFTNSLEIAKYNFESLKRKLDLFGMPSRNKNEVEKYEISIDKSMNTALISSKICKPSFVYYLVMSLTEDILDFAKIEAGIFSLNKRLFKVRDLVTDIQYIFQYQWAQKGIYFVVRCEEELMDSHFNSDVGRIKQILMNLISNAYKFTYEGGITVSIAKKKITNAFERHTWLEFSVVDTGIGISEEDQKGLFQIFGMIWKNKEKFNINGTGLGLTIVKKLVILLGGQIKLTQW